MAGVAINALFCLLLNGGVTEVAHTFSNASGASSVSVDCETPTHVIEFGHDNMDSLRGTVHDAAFAASLTGKTPMVIVIDTDGIEDRYQYEVRVVARRVGVAYGVCSEDFIHRWVATSPYRALGPKGEVNDLPVSTVAARHCDLAGELDVPGP